MTLENLLKIELLQAHDTNAEQLKKLLAAASRSLNDAGQESISNETRLDAAYRAITQLCMAALWANGYRTSRSKPGHHQTMIQSLVHSIGVATDKVIFLDTFRIKRNAIDYTGDEVDDNSVRECMSAATDLQQQVLAWLRKNKPELIE